MLVYKWLCLIKWLNQLFLPPQVKLNEKCLYVYVLSSTQPLRSVLLKRLNQNARCIGEGSQRKWLMISLGKDLIGKAELFNIMSV